MKEDGFRLDDDGNRLHVSVFLPLLFGLMRELGALSVEKEQTQEAIANKDSQ